MAQAMMGVQWITVSFPEVTWFIPPLSKRLAQLVEHRTSVQEAVGSNPGQTYPQGLKITEEKVLPL